MKTLILSQVLAVLKQLQITVSAEDLKKIQVEYPDVSLGDASCNAALILAKSAKMSPRDLAEKIVAGLAHENYQKIEVAGPGFINFTFNKAALSEMLNTRLHAPEQAEAKKILVEYFQPNIAKPLHIGHLRTAIIGDSITRCLKYLGHDVESDTHMGDWGTQFGLLILAYKKFGNDQKIAKDPIPKLNEYYIKINKDAETDPSIHEAGKQEFVKLEAADPENIKIWKQFVDWSMEKFLTINDLMDILPFDHHWPESFYQDKMPAVLDTLKQKGLLVESQGAQIVNLEEHGLGVAVVVKSDGGTTYLLRDIATFIYRKSLGFAQQIYVVDNRQSHAFKQLFKILELMGESQPDEAIHIDYGFISFKGEALSTRKGNMVLAQDVIDQAEQKVAAIIDQKNSGLANKEVAVKTIAKGALKYYDLSHNRHSDIDFDWDQALDFEGNSGPYLQYTYARLSSILRKIDLGELVEVDLKDLSFITPTEKQLLLESEKLNEVVADTVRDFLPNTLANYLYGLANLTNKFYHESIVLAETDLAKKKLRVEIIHKVQEVLKQGLELLGIKVLDEM